MFEVEFNDMSANVYIEDGMYQILTASNVGVSPDIVFCGSHKYTSRDALIVIASIDRALKNCPKYLYKKIRSQRESFVNAFGPEMIARTSTPPTWRQND